MNKKVSFALLLMLLFATLAHAQKRVNIAFIEDGHKLSNEEITTQTAEEINNILRFNYTPEFQFLYGDNDPVKIKQMLDQTTSSDDVDIIVCFGALSSMMLSQMEEYTIPSIAGLILDNNLQELPKTSIGTSGISNFTYIESPFDIKADFERFKQLAQFSNIGIVIGSYYKDIRNVWADQYLKSIFDIPFKIIPLSGDPSEDIKKFDDNIDAAYFLDVAPYDETSIPFKQLMQKINHNKIPSYALLGRTFVESGVLASSLPPNIISTYTRRIALDVMKILEGQNAAELPVSIDMPESDLLFNLATASQLNIFPGWDIMAGSILINPEHQADSIQQRSLQSTILEALQNNLQLKAAKKSPEIAAKEVSKAKSQLMPQVEASANGVLIDDKRADASRGQTAPLTFSTNATLTQIIYNGSAFSNVAIQKLLQESEQYATDKTELDIILNSATAYLQYLQAKSFEKIQNENLKVTKQNLDVSKAKEKVGHSSISDVYRLEAQLAQNKINIYDAKTQTQQAGYYLNHLLDRPQNEKFKTKEVGLKDSILLINDSRIYKMLSSPALVRQLADHMVDCANKNLPEIKQIETTIAAQQRLLESKRRSTFMPSIGINADLGKTLKRVDLADPPQGFTSPTKNWEWSIGVGASIPIFGGGNKRHDIQKTQLEILQLKDQEDDLRKQLELQVRSTIITANASYLRTVQSEIAREKAHKNFEIIQDYYKQGLIDVINLIDAQNSLLQSELSATNAIYQFIIDFLTVERSIGKFYFLASEEEKELFFYELRMAILTSK
ncbi:hypothetical protein EYV94_23735 [Puteibacter caeruleilacunae]|nr:hypothetical protein EYV94_23735 [Puteibacter caeruleilacunae]